MNTSINSFPAVATEMSGSEHLLQRNVQKFQGGLVFKAHRLVYHSTPGLRIKKKRRRSARPSFSRDKGFDVDSD